MAEREQDTSTLRAMLPQFRFTLHHALSYGFEAARFAFGTVLSLMEDGTLGWVDSHCLSEGRCSKLVDIALNQHEFCRDAVQVFARSAGASVNRPKLTNIPNSPGCEYKNL
jgi:hypothetical protein